MELETRQPGGPVYRLGRRPDAWQPPNWFLAHSDGTFGNRFDDPEGYYRVLYASSQRLACFVETLARFRPDLSLLAELAAIEGADDFLPLGMLPREWMAGNSDDGQSQHRRCLRRHLCDLVGQSPAEIARGRGASPWSERHRPEHAGERRTAAAYTTCFTASLPLEFCGHLLSLSVWSLT